MASATFKRTKIINSVKKYMRLMEDAKREMDDYGLRVQTAAGEEAAKYYTEMREQYRIKYQCYGCVVADLKYEFGILPEEVDG